MNVVNWVSTFLFTYTYVYVYALLLQHWKQQTNKQTKSSRLSSIIRDYNILCGFMWSGLRGFNLINIFSGKKFCCCFFLEFSVTRTKPLLVSFVFITHTILIYSVLLFLFLNYLITLPLYCFYFTIISLSTSIFIFIMRLPISRPSKYVNRSFWLICRTNMVKM